VFLYPKKVCLIRGACRVGAKELRRARANPENVIRSGDKVNIGKLRGQVSDLAVGGGSGS